MEGEDRDKEGREQKKKKNRKKKEKVKKERREGGGLEMRRTTEIEKEIQMVGRSEMSPIITSRTTEQNHVWWLILCVSWSKRSPDSS